MWANTRFAPTITGDGGKEGKDWGGIVGEGKKLGGDACALAPLRVK